MIIPTDTVYISGPMTGLPLFNYPKFFGLAGLIAKEYGCRVLNPARHPNRMEYEEYMRLADDDIHHSTVVIMLDGWEESWGAQTEYRLALLRGCRIFSEDDLMKDLNERLQGANPLIRIGELQEECR